MTTGRINQVTILTVRGGCAKHTLKTPKQNPQLSRQSSLQGRQAVSLQACTRQEATEPNQQHPFGHPVFPSQFLTDRSAKHRTSAVHQPGFACHPQEEDTTPQITARGRVLGEAYPRLSIASGTHRATIHRLHQSPPSRSRQVFRHLPLHQPKQGGKLHALASSAQAVVEPGANYPPTNLMARHNSDISRLCYQGTLI
jgi:hypothetical protein